MKALLVSSAPREDVQQCLLAAGSAVTVAQDGHDAIDYAERALFDVAVIVSTGGYMDLIETYLNLRDMKPSMEIVILAGQREDEDQTADTIARSFTKTHSLTLEGLAEFLGVPPVS